MTSGLSFSGRRLCIVTALWVSGTCADTAYLEPSDYSPVAGQTITLEAAFNDFCCEPKYAVRSNNYAVVLPDGEIEKPGRTAVFKTCTIVEHAITKSGTTRVTSGERLGRKGGQYAFFEGQYYLVNGDDPPTVEIPQDTQLLSSQTATVSDTYVTVGAPSWASVNHSIGRLRIVPKTHPSTLRVGDTFAIKLLFDDAPVREQSVALTRSGQRNRPGDGGKKYLSDSAGLVEIPLTSRGTHLVMTRLQAPAPPGSETALRSYTTSLTFDVTSE